jgi:hypothetical protein
MQQAIMVMMLIDQTSDQIDQLFIKAGMTDGES